MFIPRGTALHENLATSYVLVDALVADLCEGGFSGVVEIVLRDADARIVIARGGVVAAIESRNGEGRNSNPIARPYSRMTVADLADQSRRERGRVSIYSYSTEAASSIAALINAAPLYTQLSTEFADLEKMISKLGRERDRQWFVDVSTESGLAALIHLKGDGCLILTSREGKPIVESESSELTGDATLEGVLDECNRAGGVFDVYFKSATGEAGLPEDRATENGASHAVMEAKAAFESLPIEEAAPASNREKNIDEAARYGGDSEARMSAAATRAAATGSDKTSDDATSGERISSPLDLSALAGEADLRDEEHGFMASDLLLVQNDLRATGLLKRGGDADLMAEVKRLMGEVARTIEEAAQAVEPRDSFSIHLRAGQLKIAERYPFLDPFGAEFEYLAGEIVFVGGASRSEFVEGLTEALKLAAEATIKSSAQPARLRARVTDELEWLLKRQKTELEQYRLDQSVEEIITAAQKD
jgi:rRNA maturation endonuclease Nob1